MRLASAGPSVMTAVRVKKKQRGPVRPYSGYMVGDFYYYKGVIVDETGRGTRESAAGGTQHVSG
jgi:hypothetical protein